MIGQNLPPCWRLIGQYLGDLAVGGGAHLAKHLLGVVGLGGSKAGVADDVGEDHVGGSLEPPSGLDGIGLDHLEELVMCDIAPGMTALPIPSSTCSKYMCAARCPPLAHNVLVLATSILHRHIYTELIRRKI